jgi:glyoxylase-like metal-dependent hydrolase (beta-lactamase superfamily II)
VASATRLYGDQMHRLWGDIVPVPRENLRILGDRDEIDQWRVQYTPGHASHHVSFLHTPSGTAFCGDTAGVRIGEHGPVLAPTPPPDIDIALWLDSIDRIAAWRPSRLVLTHFGMHGRPEAHLAELREWLRRMAAWAAELGDAGAFAERVRGEIAARTDEPTAAAYEQGMPPDTLYAGLERAQRRVLSGR